MMWLVYALLSALFAGITAILAKMGIRNTDSHLATALRTIVVLVFAWLRGSQQEEPGAPSREPQVWRRRVLLRFLPSCPRFQAKLFCF